MSSTDSDKTRKPTTIYVQIPHGCPICKKKHKKSKKFSSPYALIYHLKQNHDTDDEISTGIHVEEVLKWVKITCKAHQIGILWA